MNKQWNGPCKSRRTWEGIFQDFGNCEGTPQGAREERIEEFDEELQLLLEESLRNVECYAE